MGSFTRPAAVVIMAIPDLSMRAAQVEVANDLDTPRPNETIEVKSVGPGPMVVRDANGKEVISQVVGDGTVIFQASFAAKETKNFTVAAGKPAVGEACATRSFTSIPPWISWRGKMIASRSAFTDGNARRHQSAVVLTFGPSV